MYRGIYRRSQGEQLSKEYIQNVAEKDTHTMNNLFERYIGNSSALVYILKNLGYLPRSFDVKYLLLLTENNNEDVRYWAVKNIGKLRSIDYFDKLRDIAINDSSTIVRCEAVSSIGRMRNRRTIPLLVDKLNDIDPKIVSQAIRGLLVFKGDNYIDEVLKKLVDNPNEIVSQIIRREYFSKSTTAKLKMPHTQTYPYLVNTVVNGDVLDVLKYVKEESIHLTFTSPPYYNARDYSIYPSYEVYLEFLEKVFQETYRITKEGRFLVLNTSPIIIPRISRSHSSKRYPIPFDIHHYLVKMGWEFIDDIVWEKPEYSVKNRVGGFAQHRKPLAYKPNSITEYLMVYRKHTSKLIDWNIHQYDAPTIEDSKVKGDFETTNVWKICPKSDKVHSAVFPTELCKKVIEYYSYKGGFNF